MVLHKHIHDIGVVVHLGDGALQPFPHAGELSLIGVLGERFTSHGLDVVYPFGASRQLSFAGVVGEMRGEPVHSVLEGLLSCRRCIVSACDLVRGTDCVPPKRRVSRLTCHC